MGAMWPSIPGCSRAEGRRGCRWRSTAARLPSRRNLTSYELLVVNEQCSTFAPTDRILFLMEASAIADAVASRSACSTARRHVIPYHQTDVNVAQALTFRKDAGVLAVISLMAWLLVLHRHLNCSSCKIVQWCRFTCHTATDHASIQA
jgi:hypothetical protein